jgi:hypothetical protein
MKKFKIHINVINQFKKDLTLNLSESGGMLYWLDDKQKEIVNKFQERYPNKLVYHIIRDFTNFGEMLSLLFVDGSYIDEFEQERNDIEDGYVLSYVHNVTMEDCSEFGTIVVKPSIGGLKRIF